MFTSTFVRTVFIICLYSLSVFLLFIFLIPQRYVIHGELGIGTPSVNTAEGVPIRALGIP